MARSKLEIEKFDKNGDFNMQKMKIQALLENLGLDETIVDEEQMISTIILETLKKVRNILILSFCDQILRKVSMEVSVFAIQKKLKEIYMVKSLPNRLIYLKQFFFFFFLKYIKGNRLIRIQMNLLSLLLFLKV